MWVGNGESAVFSKVNKIAHPETVTSEKKP